MLGWIQAAMQQNTIVNISELPMIDLLASSLHGDRGLGNKYCWVIKCEAKKFQFKT